MKYVSRYDSPLGEIIIASDDIGLIGLWFEGQKYYLKELDKEYIWQDNIFISNGKKWLDSYFKGNIPKNKISIHMEGTDFQKLVWEILEEIPYGEVRTYKEICLEVKKRKNVENMAIQAIGRAISHNKIAIIIPCHRVIGSNGKLVGYAGGIDRKERLLEIEKR